MNGGRRTVDGFGRQAQDRSWLLAFSCWRHAWFSHFTEMTAVIRYPCDCEPFTEHEHFGFSRDVRNGER